MSVLSHDFGSAAGLWLKDLDVTSTAPRGQADVWLQVRPLRQEYCGRTAYTDRSREIEGCSPPLQGTGWWGAILTVVVRPGGCEWAG